MDGAPLSYGIAHLQQHWIGATNCYPKRSNSSFARLGVFQSNFNLQAALTVVSDEILTQPKVLEALANLTAKSMIVAEPGHSGPIYRLLDTTRSYAVEKLGSGASVDKVRRRHAEYLRVEQVDHNSASSAGPELSLRDYRPLVDELRSALRWCFSSHGDPLLGIHLTVSLASNWYAVTLFLEFAEEVHRTLQRLKDQGGLSPETEMQLLLAFIPALYNTEGFDARRCIKTLQGGACVSKRYDRSYTRFASPASERSTGNITMARENTRRH